MRWLRRAQQNPKARNDRPVDDRDVLGQSIGIGRLGQEIREAARPAANRTTPPAKNIDGAGPAAY
jgi:hypothetical protein